VNHVVPRTVLPARGAVITTRTVPLPPSPSPFCTSSVRVTRPVAPAWSVTSTVTERAPSAPPVVGQGSDTGPWLRVVTWATSVPPSLSAKVASPAAASSTHVVSQVVPLARVPGAGAVMSTRSAPPLPPLPPPPPPPAGSILTRKASLAPPPNPARRPRSVGNDVDEVTPVRWTAPSAVAASAFTTVSPSAT
jgi:hypothetical protein